MKKIPALIFSLLLILLIALLLTFPRVPQQPAEETIRKSARGSNTSVVWADFEQGDQPWQTEAPARVEISGPRGWHGKQFLQLYPGDQKVVSVSRKNLENWSDWDRLEGHIWLPPDYRQELQCYLLLADREHFWYCQQPPERLRPGWNLISFSLDDPQNWSSLKHERPWSRQVATNLSQVVFRFQSATSLPAVFRLDYFCLLRTRKDTVKTLLLQDFVTGPTMVERYHLWEASFLLSRAYANPFDPTCVDVTATFIGPDGSSTVVPAFYSQQYRRQLIEGKEVLTPVGDSRWTVRFTPVRTGRYLYFFTVNDGQQNKFPGSSFVCVPSAEKGFVRVSQRDPRFFEYDDGSFYYPVGFNIISPWDTPYGVRYLPTMPVGRETYAYDDYFEKMAQNRMNFIRMWMAYWWLELEWNPDRGPFQGLGRYSLSNAWRLDHIVSAAERKGIKILLTINNHTRLTGWGWPDNPYNVTNGGFLRHPWEMFTSEQARELFRRKMRYILARWGYSPAIFAWNLWSEVDLTGDYQPERVRKWHQEMASFIRENDPWKHMISTHFCQHPRARDLADLPELDFIHSNAWVNVAGLSDSQVEALEQFYQALSPYRKPVMVSEFGGHWAGTQIEIMTRDLHTGLWASATIPLAGTPLFWWWNLVHQDDLYFHYRSLAAFLKAEDYRGKGLAPKKVGFIKAHPAADVRCLAGPDLCFLWVYNFYSALRLVQEKNEIQDLCLLLPGLKQGKYRVEWWDTRTGRPFQVEEATCGETGLVLKVPAFTEDLAAKVKYCHD